MRGGLGSISDWVSAAELDVENFLTPSSGYVNVPPPGFSAPAPPALNASGNPASPSSIPPSIANVLPPSVGGPNADPVSQSNFVAAQLRQANQTLISLEQSLVASASTNPNYVNVMSPLVQEGRQRYETLLSAYNDAYGAAFGNAPDQTGLSQWQIYVGAGAVLLTIAAAAYELNQYLAGVNAQKQANLTNAQNTAYAMNQAAKAQQAGDTQTAQQWQAIASKTAAAQPKPAGAGAWFEENWPYVAAGLAAFFVLPKLIE